MQLIFLWILYVTYATMYFCQAMLCGIFLMLELMTMMGYAFNPYVKGFAAVCIWLMLIYDVVAMVICYRAYSAFSAKFNQM